ncbi:Ribosomal protein S6 modification protein [Alcanivorax sp. P2S70]|jgi:hypothetical protein|uniref:retropepsin-like aspartic peptidase RloA3 n=1 Tax=Alcanivorax sp. P2S70 TaxID=1397527 RepID=UPI0003B69274|nr:ATP-dependent zinc protease [Alcanivorax sp. P2S70]ERP91487.1 Ribosomal protein S6 modification protein [Alcanivorax sp. P2S70]
MKKGLVTALALSLLSTSGLAMAKQPQGAKNIYGWVEKTTLEPWGVELKTKLDSGALTSSLHATDVEVFDKDGDNWVRFKVKVKDEATGKIVSKTFEKPRYRKVLIRGAGGEERRPVVLMKLCVGDTLYEEQFTLNDRSDMIYPVLLGRRTLSHLGYLDVTETFLHSPDCDENSPVKLDKDQEDDKDISD